MRAGSGRTWLAAIAILLLGAVTGAPAAVVKESPADASSRQPSPSRIPIQTDPALSTGEVAMPQVPDRSRLTPDSARGGQVAHPPHVDGAPPSQDADAVIRQPVSIRPLHAAPAAPQAVEVPVIPEPSTGVLLLAAGVAALTRRGRRHSRQ